MPFFQGSTSLLRSQLLRPPAVQGTGAVVSPLQFFCCSFLPFLSHTPTPSSHSILPFLKRFSQGATSLADPLRFAPAKDLCQSWLAPAVSNTGTQPLVSSRRSQLCRFPSADTVTPTPMQHFLS